MGQVKTILLELRGDEVGQLGQFGGRAIQQDGTNLVVRQEIY